MLLGGRGLRAAHRLREPGQSDARPRQRARPRARHPLGPRRVALGSRARPARGEPPPVARRRGARGRSSRRWASKPFAPPSRPRCRASRRSPSICACWPLPCWWAWRAGCSSAALRSSSSAGRAPPAARRPSRARARRTGCTSGCAAGSSSPKSRCAVVLLVGSGLFLASFTRVASVDLGLDPRDVLTVRVRPLVGRRRTGQLAQQRHPGAAAHSRRRRRAPYPASKSRRWSHGGVPLRGDVRTTEIRHSRPRAAAGRGLDFNEISPDYFRAMRVPLLEGRLFTDDDRQGCEPVVIINEAAASRYFPGERSDREDRPVPGRAADRRRGRQHPTRRARDRLAAAGIRAARAEPAVGATLVLRLSRDDRRRAARGQVRHLVAVSGPGAARHPDALGLPGTADRRSADSSCCCFSLLGLLGTVITCVGIYGVMAYVVELRTHEIGIRMASGRGPARILSSVLGQALTYLGGGLALGLPARLAARRARVRVSLPGRAARSAGLCRGDRHAGDDRRRGGALPRAARGARRSAGRAA